MRRPLVLIPLLIVSVSLFSPAHASHLGLYCEGTGYPVTDDSWVTENADTHTGNDTAQIWNSKGGSDNLNGKGGADRICGAPGLDELHGGPDGDAIYTQAPSTGGTFGGMIYGEKGNDYGESWDSTLTDYFFDGTGSDTWRAGEATGDSDVWWYCPYPVDTDAEDITGEELIGEDTTTPDCNP